jgi:hypothetical protein
MSTITTKQQASIASKLATMQLPSGLGNKQSACSIATINLALSGRLTDEIPDCMSEVIGRWIIVVQDAMPDDVRNSARWKSLLPLAAGTGRDREQERLDIILDWMWGTVLPSLQPIADQQGFGKQWQKMTTERTAASANAVAEVAGVAAATVAAWAAATVAARVAGAAARGAATWAAGKAAEVVVAAREAEAWANFDQCGLLERLIKIDTALRGAQPAPALVPLTDEQRSKMYRTAVLRGDSIMMRSDYELGISDAEAAHGVAEGQLTHD